MKYKYKDGKYYDVPISAGISPQLIGLVAILFVLLGGAVLLFMSDPETGILMLAFPCFIGIVFLIGWAGSKAFS